MSRTDDDVPKLPRGRWFGALRTVEIIRIGMVATVLVVVIVLGRPCADGIARFVESYAPPPDAGPASAPAMKYERLTEEEIKKRFPGGDELDAKAPAAPAAPP
ncbi:MAG TPA: hypothetical protein VFU21_30365 [Kofleriaceae bacterium]|nr:hypothetical protein [Kofleriaceae bacterium]